MNEKNPTIELSKSFFGRLFSSEKKIILKVFEDRIEIYNENNQLINVVTDPVNEFELSNNWLLGSVIKVKNQEKNFIYRFIKKRDINNCRKRIEDYFCEISPFIIRKLVPKIISQFENSYLRQSQVSTLRKDIQQLKRNYEYLEKINLQLSEKINNEFLKSTNFSKACSNDNDSQILLLCKYSEMNSSDLIFLRSKYEELMEEKYRGFFEHAEQNPLTQMQELAVIRNDDFNLVLAAAGTGKTSVMVAKALYLIKEKSVPSSELLILAYNRSAANELKNRIEERAKFLGIHEIPQIYTFHALGRKILLECNYPIHTSLLCEDEKKLRQWISDWERKFISQDPMGYCNFLDAIYTQDKDELGVIEDDSIRTLKDEKVKSNSERKIANWLYMHGIDYQYEAQYKTKCRLEIGTDYRPDFKLTDDVYIEFFGIDRYGNTRKDIDKNKYNQDMELKKDLHRKQGTILIDLYYYEIKEGTLFTTLEQRLSELGFTFRERTPEEIKKLIEQNIKSSEKTPLQDLFTNCLKAIRTERLNNKAIFERLAKANFTGARTITNHLQRLTEEYIGELERNNEIDFDDMIIKATDLINTDKWKPSFKYILIDEFQDISTARFELIKAIYNKCENVSCTMVGDDWQAIYRFSGGKLELTTRFTEYFGLHSLTKLSKTFRYPKNIAQTAGTFIMKNPEQYKKQIETADTGNNSVIHLYSYHIGTSNVENRYDNMNQTAYEIIRTIEQHRPNVSIAVMARYNFFLKCFNNYLKTNELLSNIQTQIKYWTFHSSKGLEADYTIILGLQNGDLGFPSNKQENKIVEALLPTQDPFLYSEERRLFYVALTRAKYGCYLLAQDLQPSVFITELLSSEYNLDIKTTCFSKDFQRAFKCPYCKYGYFQQKHGKFGGYYECNSNTCSIKARICPKCNSPMVDGRYKSKCQNPTCGYVIPICERCGRPMILRNSQYGKFWGCSGYGLERDSCNNKWKYYKH